MELRLAGAAVWPAKVGASSTMTSTLLKLCLLGVSPLSSVLHRVQVRAAPCMRFAYVEPRLMPLYLKFKSPQQAPSMLTAMTLEEFAMRAQSDSADSPLFYPDGEFYYMQSPVTRDMRMSGDISFEQAPFSAVLAPGK